VVPERPLGCGEITQGDVQLCREGIEVDGRRIGLERVFEQRKPLFTAFLLPQNL
jgi:hypothetical protein